MERKEHVVHKVQMEQMEQKVYLVRIDVSARHDPDHGVAALGGGGGNRLPDPVQSHRGQAAGASSGRLTVTGGHGCPTKISGDESGEETPKAGAL